VIDEDAKDIFSALMDTYIAKTWDPMVQTSYVTDYVDEHTDKVSTDFTVPPGSWCLPRGGLRLQA
jgi:hypothetical protein